MSGPDQCPAQVRETTLASIRLTSGRALTQQATAWGQAAWRNLQQPRQLRLLQTLVAVLAVLWILFGIARLFWALWPQPVESGLAPPVNPAQGAVRQTSASGASIDLQALQAAALFGRVEPGIEAAQALPAEQVVVREGIEDGARETRLDLVLRGVAASSVEGMGSAVIEARGQQAVYAVDDVLPLPGRVVLAKVLPDRVVLDNAGTYELLRLYDESQLDRVLQRRPAAMESPSGPQQLDQRDSPEVAELASRYREQLYRDPQSLAALVRIAPVREGGALQGYRIAPGEDREQFERLGFRSGDLVVAVNGMPLSDPANAMRLYQLMRSAAEATFELLRDGQPLAVSISLGDAAPDA